MRRYSLKIKDRSFDVTVHRFNTDEAELEVNGERYIVRVDAVEVIGEGPERRQAPRPLPSKPAPPGAPAPASATSAGGGEGAVTAPIPGLILQVFVENGDAVKAGQPVLKMEAMKMETVVSAPADGRVTNIRVNTGDSVSQGQELRVIG